MRVEGCVPSKSANRRWPQTCWPGSTTGNDGLKKPRIYDTICT